MIGDKIRQKRLELGLTQEELAHRLGYKDKTAINKIETNKNGLKADKLVRFAEALGCDPNILLDTPEHREHPNDVVLSYAKKLMNLPPAMLDNVLQYIDFLEKKGEKNESDG